MKTHIGVDAESGVVHSMTTTPANHHDITQADQLLHEEEKDVFGDSGYRCLSTKLSDFLMQPDLNPAPQSGSLSEGLAKPL